MIVNLYVSEEECSPRFGLIAHDRPVSLLPGRAAWRHVRDLDTRDLALPKGDRGGDRPLRVLGHPESAPPKGGKPRGRFPSSPDRDLTGIRLLSPGLP